MIPSRRPRPLDHEAVEDGEDGASAPRAGIGVRLLAGGLGVAALLVGGLFTVGTALAAPVGVGLAGWAMRKRGRALTRFGSWAAAVGAAAVGAAAVATALALTLLVANLPEGSVANALAAAESAEPQPQPEWLERIAPYTAPDPTVERIVKSRPAVLYFGLVGAGLGCLIMGGIAGSAGWAATFLLGYAAGGRWLLGGRTG